MDDDGDVDYERLAAVIDHVESGGVDGVVPCGTTGERSTLRPDEHRRVIEFTVEEASTPVIAGTGSASTWETVEITRHAEAVGADGALVIGPYYTGPNEDDLVTHYREVADAVDIPLLVYNFPGGMSFNIPPGVVERLASHPNVAGIKDSSGDVGQVEELCRRTRDADFDVLSGWDSLLLPAVSVGAVGLVGICANVFPADSVDLLAAAKEGDVETAIDLHDRFASLEEALLVEKPQITVKQALALRGVCEPNVRAPHTQLDDDQVEELRSVVDAFHDGA
jgi:4-hydroxy-tetrahydrodipicolinate synthase